MQGQERAGDVVGQGRGWGREEQNESFPAYLLSRSVSPLCRASVQYAGLRWSLPPAPWMATRTRASSRHAHPSLAVAPGGTGSAWLRPFLLFSYRVLFSGTDLATRENGSLGICRDRVPSSASSSSPSLGSIPVYFPGFVNVGFLGRTRRCLLSKPIKIRSLNTSSYSCESFSTVMIQLNPHPTHISLRAPVSFGLFKEPALDSTFPLPDGRFRPLHLDPFCGEYYPSCR